MRIAIQLFGHLRTFEKTYKSFFENVVEPNKRDGFDVDIFIHTWNEKDHSTVTYRNPDGSGFKNNDVDDNVKSLVKNIYKPKKVLYENQLECDDFVFIEKTASTKRSFKGVLNNAYTIYKSSILRNDYEKENNIKYDWVIVTRPDIEFFSQFRLSEILFVYKFLKHKIPDNALFYGLSIFGRGNVDDPRFIGGSDLIYFGTPKNIDIATSLYKEWKDDKWLNLFNKDDFWSFEYWWMNFWRFKKLSPMAIKYFTKKDYYPMFNKIKSKNNFLKNIKNIIWNVLGYIIPYRVILWYKKRDI